MADSGSIPLPAQTGQPFSGATSMSGASLKGRLADFAAQPAIRKSIPAFGGLGALVLIGVMYFSLSTGPERILYSSLSDGERAQVVETLETGGVDYSIDSGNGTVTVAESDVYRARMLVASNGALAVPETAGTMLDSIPLGASRTLEGERLKLARERELMLTIMEIDGIEAVRVHLATPERSVFVRERVAPSASVMVRLARGRNLDKGQVDAIVNLVAGSVPGLKSGEVRVADQNGQLLSDTSGDDNNGLNLQREFESKLQGQLTKLLIPILGEGNFSSEVQVELDMEESTSARETYDKEGALRNESESRSQRAAATQAGGVPGVLANTPPPPAELVEGAPQGNKPEAPTTGGDSESSARRNYALDREVAVRSTRPGGIARLSVAVAVSEQALKKIAPADEAKIQSLISAAVGAQPDRGDIITVIVGKFEPAAIEDPPFYETAWFEMALRYGAALVAVLLVLMLAVRPLLAIMRGDKAPVEDEPADDDDTVLDAEESASNTAQQHEITSEGPTNLREQIALARRLANEQPDRAVNALQRMLEAPEPSAGS